MARGKQKVQAQEKNAKLQAKLKKQAAKGGSGSAAVKNSMSCKICFAQVIGNALKRTKLEQHHEAKHGALDFYKCWPSISPAALAAAASASASAAAAPKYKADKPKAGKKKSKKRRGAAP